MRISRKNAHVEAFIRKKTNNSISYVFEYCSHTRYDKSLFHGQFFQIAFDVRAQASIDRSKLNDQTCGHEMALCVRVFAFSRDSIVVRARVQMNIYKRAPILPCVRVAISQQQSNYVPRLPAYKCKRSQYFC